MKKLNLNLILILILSSPAFGQKGKKSATWQDSMLFVWGIDSNYRSHNGIWEKSESEDKDIMICFFGGGRVLVWKNKNQDEMPLVSQYESLQGDRKRYLSLETAEALMVIEKLTTNNLIISGGDEYFQTRLYLSKRTAELPAMEPWLIGGYQMRNAPNSSAVYPGKGWTVYPPLSALTVPLDEEWSFLILDSAGRMKHTFGEGDSGTWTMSENLLLVLKGTKASLSFELVSLQDEKIGLHPVGTPPDSVLPLRKHWLGIYGSEEYRIADSVRIMDSLMMAMAMEEAEMAADYVVPETDIVGGTWKTIPEGTSTLTLSEDGKVVFTNGKKKHEGTWTRTDYSYNYGEQYIILTLEGKEQLARYVIVQTDDREMLTMELTLTFLPPKSKALRTLVMRRGQ